MRKYLLVAGVLITVLASLAAANHIVPPVYGSIPIQPTQDLKCYLPDHPIADPPPVKVTDKFGTEMIDPNPFPFVCTSAVKTVPPNPSDPTIPDILHWNAYPTFVGIDPPPEILTDQFGSRVVDASPGSGFLVVPVLKETSAHPLQGDLSAMHWKCYPYFGTTIPPMVGLKDQFGFMGLGPSSDVDFCTPAIKILSDGSTFGSLDGPDLICYKLPTVSTNNVVSLVDQFTGPAPVPTALVSTQLLYTLAQQAPVGVPEFPVGLTILLSATAPIAFLFRHRWRPPPKF